jgi:hypothetical protein
MADGVDNVYRAAVSKLFDFFSKINVKLRQIIFQGSLRVVHLIHQI